jgi:membrane protein DedA with SNARE-associated domain
MIEQVHQFWLALTTGGLPEDFGLFSYVLIALLVAIEGPVVTVLAAALAGAGLLDPWGVAGAAALGNLMADSAWYWLGRLGQFERLTLYFPWLRRFGPQVAELEALVKRKGLPFLFVAKLVLWSVTIPTLVAAGMARVAWPRLLVVIAAAEIIWTGALVLLGEQLGAQLPEFQLWVQWLAVGGLVLMTLGLPLLLKCLPQRNAGWKGINL